MSHLIHVSSGVAACTDEWRPIRGLPWDYLWPSNILGTLHATTLPVHSQLEGIPSTERCCAGKHFQPRHGSRTHIFRMLFDMAVLWSSRSISSPQGLGIVPCCAFLTKLYRRFWLTFRYHRIRYSLGAEVT